MKSNPVKVSGKLFRYDFDHSVVEYIIKADAETISEENSGSGSTALRCSELTPRDISSAQPPA